MSAPFATFADRLRRAAELLRTETIREFPPGHEVHGRLKPEIRDAADALDADATLVDRLMNTRLET